MGLEVWRRLGQNHTYAVSFGGSDSWHFLFAQHYPKKISSRLYFMCSTHFCWRCGQLNRQYVLRHDFQQQRFLFAQYCCDVSARWRLCSFLHGQVVDMLYFPLIDSHFPSWMPIWGGEEFEFFSPVFNIADASISVGVIAILLWQKRFFPKHISPSTGNPTVITTSSDGTQMTRI